VGVVIALPKIRPTPVNPLNQEPAHPSGIYDPHVQADVAQFQRARGDTYPYGLDYADSGASPDTVPGTPGAPGLPGIPPLPTPTFPSTVIEPDRFHRTARIPWSLTAALGSTLILPAASPSTPRVFLLLFWKNASTGLVYIDFDNSATAAYAPIELGVGGNALFDEFVPQGDVYALAATSGTLVVTFANGP
jgi:hypothetical protein